MTDAEWTDVCQSAATHFAKVTQAPYAIVMLSNGDGKVYIGCWAPPEIAAEMMKQAAESLADGSATIIDRTGAQRQ